MREGLNNQIDAYERYLTLRVETPQEMRVEGVFSFDDLLQMKDARWPTTSTGTFEILVDAFVTGGAVVLVPKDIYTAHIEQYCLTGIATLR